MVTKSPTRTNSVKSFMNNTSRKLRLRTALVVPFVLQIVAAVGLVGYLSFGNGQIVL